MPNAKFY